MENRTKITSLFATQTATINSTLEASYEIFLLIAKSGKNQRNGKQLLKLAISVFTKKILQMDDKDVHYKQWRLAIAQSAEESTR